MLNTRQIVDRSLLIYSVRCVEKNGKISDVDTFAKLVANHYASLITNREDLNVITPQVAIQRIKSWKIATLTSKKVSKNNVKRSQIIKVLSSIQKDLSESECPKSVWEQKFLDLKDSLNKYENKAA